MAQSMGGLLRRALSSSGVCCFRDSFEAIGRWLPKVPSNMMPTEKTPKLQLNRKTAPEKFIYFQLRAVVLIWTHHLQLHCQLSGVKIYHRCPSFSHKNLDQIFRLCRPLRHLEAPSVLPLPSIAHWPRLFSPHPTDPWPGRFHATSLRGFWGGYPSTNRHVKVQGEKNPWEMFESLCVFFQNMLMFCWLNFSPPKKKQSSSSFFRWMSHCWWPTPPRHSTTPRHREGHLLLEGL